MGKKYFLDQDHSSHWYIIEAMYRNEWNEWLDLDGDDERAWQVPDFAKEVGRNLQSIEFSDYEIV